MNLAERCDQLERENLHLRSMLRSCDAARYPAKWALNAGEQRVLTSLISAPDGFRTHEALLHAGRKYDDTAVDAGLVKVLVARLRTKLRPYGIRIHTMWGAGYKIDPESKAIVIAARTREVVQ
jgi:DNA-binding response OmpR family regulator